MAKCILKKTFQVLSKIAPFIALVANKAGMKVVILGSGTSTGVPRLGGPDGAGDWGECDPEEPRNRRTRVSIMVESDEGKRLLIDTSSDCRAQLLANRIGHIDAVFWTHDHADHCHGIDDLRPLRLQLELLKPQMVHVIDPASARDTLARGAATLIDCRYDMEYEESRIPGARLVPLTTLRREGAFALDPDTPYIVYCRSGRRSSAAASAMSAIWAIERPA